ncbi:L-threonylcarbamoyladenylate synthase [Sinimarinibacterium thermocellulolyticum]|uniref:Threonylcarbamoyl-AMP synthase n=1 Tax=Sinimarinibacterium thermocellulolyticum TaxID=3170016 RepID=A0ABV2A8S4_9GAMM
MRAEPPAQRDGMAPANPLIEAVTRLRDGGLVAFPTETVYGLGADARNPAAVARIFAAKGRPADHPLIVHLADAAQLRDWACEVPRVARRLARKFWPGPLTMILPRAAGVPDAVTGGLDTVALRVPAHPLALALLRAFDGGIAAPSANRYGRVSPTRAEHVREELGAAVDLVLDGGPCAVGIESTIVDVTGDRARILRPGPITKRQLMEVLGASFSPIPGGAVRAPGCEVSHYAPLARVVLTSGAQAVQVVEHWWALGMRVGLLSGWRPPTLEASVAWLSLPETGEEQARALYCRLREADHLGLDVLVAVLPPAIGLGLALRDRLRRAAGSGDVSAPVSRESATES